MKIKNIFMDLLVPFERFIHWNTSKLVIFISSFFLGLLSTIPFLIIFYILEKYSNIKWGIIFDILTTDTIGINNPALTQIYNNNQFFFNIYSILAIVAIGFFILFFYYGNILLAKLHLSYLEKNDLSVSKNDYFNLKNIKKYFLITINNILYLLLPIIIFLVGYFIILLIYPVAENTSNIFSNTSDFFYFSNYSFLVFFLSVFCIIYFLYLVYRLIFSYIILIDKKNYQGNFKYSFYIKESFSLTRSIKKFFIFIISFGLLLIILFPLYKIGDIIKSNLISNIKTINYKTKQIPILLGEKEKISSNNINLQKLNRQTQKYTIIYIIYLFIYFLILTGIINLFLVSFYRRLLIMDRKTIKHEKGISGKFIVKEKIKIVKR